MNPGVAATEAPLLKSEHRQDLLNIWCRLAQVVPLQSARLRHVGCSAKQSANFRLGFGDPGRRWLLRRRLDAEHVLGVLNGVPLLGFVLELCYPLGEAARRRTGVRTALNGWIH